MGGGFMTCSERIRELREDRDFTQVEIAKVINVVQRTYSDYEIGKTRIPIDRLIVLARFYNVSMDYICGISGIKKSFPTRQL
jgi:transcriptional regulator with XRE-family HTH domain